MKKILLTILTISLVFSSCSKDEEFVSITLKHTHNWDGTSITNQDFNEFKFTNANGEKISIERLRYLISNITLTASDGQEINIGKYNLVNIGENTGLNVAPQNTIATGTYKLSFTFGFSDADNQDGVYQDLNSVSFNVPGMLGGGYHYMQFDGKYKDASNQDQPFNYHAIRAVDRTDPNNLVFQDTSFKVDLGTVNITSNAVIEIKMNIAEWFKNPNTWDLNQLNTVLMPNFNAQKMMSANGKSVFSLGTISN